MDTTDDFGLGRDWWLKMLAGHIEGNLEERHFCVVFEDEVERPNAH